MEANVIVVGKKLILEKHIVRILSGSAYLAVVGQESSGIVDIQLCGRNLNFKLDMGAEVTAISEAVYKTLGHVPLQKPTKMLFGPSAERLQTLGEFEGILAHGDTKCKQRVFVVKILRSNLSPIRCCCTFFLFGSFYWLVEERKY